MRILRSILGILAGSLISFASSVAWFFSLTHHDPSSLPSLGFLLATAVFATVVALAAGYAAGVLAGETAIIVGRAVAGLVAFVAVFSWFETPGRSHWPQVVAILLMTPAVVTGSVLAARKGLNRQGNL